MSQIKTLTILNANKAELIIQKLNSLLKESPKTKCTCFLDIGECYCDK